MGPRSAGDLPPAACRRRAGTPVRGAADRFQRVEYGQRFADDLDAELVRIEGGRHVVPEDHPGEVASAVNRLLLEV